MHNNQTACLDGWHNNTELSVNIKTMMRSEKRMELLLLNEWKYALEYDPKRRISYTNRVVINALLTAMSEFESRYTPTDFELSQAWKLV